MDKIKLHTEVRNIVLTEIIENNFERVNNPLSRVDTYQNKDRGIVVNLQGFGTSIITNPTRFMSGNNIEQIDRPGLIEFIPTFEDFLKIDSDRLNLTGLHFNQNINTRYPPATYLPLFRGKPKSNRTEYRSGHGLTFANATNSFVIYDKLKELEKRGEPVPHHLSNLLRLELEINKRLNKTKSFQRMENLHSLTSPSNYNAVVKEWKKHYEAIEKQTTYNIKNLHLPFDMHPAHERIIESINNNGIESFVSRIETKYRMGYITYYQMKKEKEQALQLWSKFLTDNHHPHDLLFEVNEKVNEALNRFNL